jgi:chemotaxis protein methyltransferase CheR
MTGGVDPALFARARQLITERTGFRDDAIAPESLERLVRSEFARGRTLADLMAELQHPDSEFSLAIVRASLVGETYFFRHPEHFRFIAQTGIPSMLRRHVPRLRGWSAGCATGEEAYSLAACLLACVPPRMPVEVLGTDLHEGSLAAARRATYGAWSRRDSGPHLFPLYRPLEERQVVILDSVRNITTFMASNLMVPLAEGLGPFEFILCRNVLTYFAPSAREMALKNLIRSLVPGGYIFLGTVEVDRPPAGLVRVGPPELQAFYRPLPGEVVAQKPPSRTGLPAVGAYSPAPDSTSLPRGSSRSGLPAVGSAPPSSQASAAPRGSSQTGLPAVGSSSPAPGAGGPPRGAAPPMASSRSGSPAISRATPPPIPQRTPSQFHLEALERIEQGEVSLATSMLEALVRQHPDYLPGLLELALLRVRNGSTAAAYPLMRDVYARAAKLPPDQMVEGPESLPARFYKASADAYLNLGAAE